LRLTLPSFMRQGQTQKRTDERVLALLKRTEEGKHRRLVYRTCGEMVAGAEEALLAHRVFLKSESDRSDEKIYNGSIRVSGQSGYGIAYPDRCRL